jgi:streptogramin lyase
MRSQGGVAKFNKRTEEFQTWGAPPEYNFDRMNVSMIALNPDGTVWFKDSPNLNAHRLDPRTGKIETFKMPNDFYGIESDSKGNLYMASLNSHKIGVMDGKTGKWEIFTPPTPRAAPRRGAMDRQDRFWFGEYLGGKVGMFDSKTKQIKEWPVPPTPWSGPYDVVVDKNGEVWAGGEFTDYAFRLNPNTGQVTSYLLPTLDINMRNVAVDDSTSPVTFWVGENHQAKIAKVEPLD